MNVIEGLLMAFLALFLGILCGWVFAHSAVAKECEKLGGFYVGGAIYECARKESA